MNKSLNMLNNIELSGVDQAHYRPSAPRVALGLAGVALTLMTVAAAVILPAQLHPPGARPPMKASPSGDLVRLASITVVAAREPAPAVIERVSSAAR